MSKVYEYYLNLYESYNCENQIEEVDDYPRDEFGNIDGWELFKRDELEYEKWHDK